MTGRSFRWVLNAIAMLGVNAILTSQAGAADASTCWSPAELLEKPNDPRVRVGRFAYRAPPPDVEITQQMRLTRYYRKAVRRFRIKDGRKLVALTFDIGEQPHEISGYQGKIFDHLRKHNVKATVFLGGKWMVTHPVRTQQFIADPLFEVANHGWEHRNLRLLNTVNQQRAIMRAQSAYEDQWRALEKRNCKFSADGALAHKNARPSMNLWRFPFGACRADSLKLAGDAGLLSIQWDLSSSDPWKGQTKTRMTRAVVPRVKPGSIVLFHANGRGWHTSAAIAPIITGLKKRGYEFVTIGDLLELTRQGKAEPILTDTCYDSRPGDTNRYDKLSSQLHAKYARFLRRIKGASIPGVQTPPQAKKQQNKKPKPRKNQKATGSNAFNRSN